MRRAFFVVLLLSFMAGERRIAWPASFDFTTIDVLNSVTTNAFGINNQGQIVGGYDGHGFLLSRGTFTTIDVPNSQGTGANRINDRGQIVGNYGDVSGRPLGFLLSGAPSQPLTSRTVTGPTPTGLTIKARS